LAAKYGDVKFCEIRADLCIEGYPEKNTPTILVYKDGDIKKQIITLRELSGSKTQLEDLEKLLVDVGAIRQNDVRLRKKDGGRDSEDRDGRSSYDEDGDDEWD